MKKIFVIVIVILSLALLFKTDNNEQLRIRVIANSDLAYDQQIKQQVVSIIKQVVKPNDTEELIKSKIATLDSRIAQKLDPMNIEYEIGIKNIEFPPKTLNGEVIPGGVFKSLVVIIGEGKGKNWWSLLYPEYFNITFEDIEAGNVEFRSFFLDLFSD